MPHITRIFAILEKTVRAMLPPKRQKLYIRWVSVRNQFLTDEVSFDPKKNITYLAGDIITVEFGFNVGTELGGRHPAVVLEDNPRSAHSVMIVPLSSLEPHQSEANVHENDVYLDELVTFNQVADKIPGTKSFAVINQLRSISKVRIITPTKRHDTVVHLSAPKLKKIYDKISARYTSKGLGRQDGD